jgi:hypothetical protein
MSRQRLAKIKGSLVAGFNLITSFLQQATAQGSRSTVLRPVGWMLSICIAATLGAVYVKASFWIVVLFAVFSSLAASLYVIAYVYCLFGKKEDLLRSETYSIQRLAIEKGFRGDSLTGIITEQPSTKLLPTSEKSTESESQ